MEIRRTISGKSVLLSVSGKLDAYWSSALSQEIEANVKGGAQHITLDLEDVDFISSAGLRVLLIWLKQLKAMMGSFSVVHPSAQVLGILDMSGLTELLVTVPGAAVGGELPLEGLFADERGRYHTFHLEDVAPAALEFLHPTQPGSGEGADYPHVRYPSTRLGIGIGAFGDAGSGIEARFGEYLSACGITVCLPTDGRNHPDYMMEDGVFVPSLSVYTGLSSDASFSHSIVFEAAEELQGVRLSQLASLVLQECVSPAAMVLIVAESAFLIGASARVSPVMTAEPFTFPGVRENFSFTTEPSVEPAIALVVGVVSSSSSDALRPIGIDGAAYGHLHAVSLSHRPLPAGGIEPRSFMRKLFDEEHVRTVMHLLHDDRHAATSIESEFLRGVIWVHPLTSIDGVSI